MAVVGEKLPRSMKAVVTHRPGDYRLEEAPVPQAGPGEMVVKILAAGICAGDAKCFDGAPYFGAMEPQNCTPIRR